MFCKLTCRNGHRWEPGPMPALFGEDRCPRCGAPTRSPLHVGPVPWVILGLFEVNLLSAGFVCFLYWDRLGALLPLGAAAALSGVAVWLVAWAARVRRLEAVCGALGFTFTAELSPARLKALEDFHVLHWGKSPTAYHLMEGHQDGCAVALLEVRYGFESVPAGPPPRTVAIVGRGLAAPAPARDFARHFRAGRAAAGAIQEAVPGTAAAPAVADRPAGGPAFRLEPLAPGDWIGQRLGWLDTPFPHHPGFSKSYRVDGPCGEDVRRALRPEVLDVFAAHPGWSVEVLGGRLLAHRPGPCHPDDCPRLITEVVTMYRALVSAWAESPAAGPRAPQEAPS
jgi:hypothetical protein